MYFYLKAARQQPEESVGNVRVDENRGRRQHMLTLAYVTQTNITNKMRSCKVLDTVNAVQPTLFIEETQSRPEFTITKHKVLY